MAAAGTREALPGPVACGACCCWSVASHNRWPREVSAGRVGVGPCLAADLVPHLRARQGPAHHDPGLAYSVTCALEPGRSSWTALLDARWLAPGEDDAEVTATQARQVVTGLVDAGH